jgi:type I pantothenate kinase
VTDAYASLADAARRAHLRSGAPVLVGIAGGVGVGKSTTAALVREHLHDVRVEILPTDAFILPNAELARAGIEMRKGFPESFDERALDDALARLARGEAVDVPVYSHTTYDRVPDAHARVGPADIVIVEGVNALQPPAAARLHVGVYLDAAERDIEAWFVDRFLALCAAAVAIPPADESFYRGFASMDVEEQRRVAVWTWREINAVNLREHIRPSRDRATHVVTKRFDHTVARVALRG